jgi:hypothetical protein
MVSARFIQLVGSPGLTNVHIDARVLAFAIGISAATAVAFGLTCGLTVRAGNLWTTLSSSSRTTASTPARRAASTLVVSEMAQPLGPNGAFLYPESLLELQRSVQAHNLQVNTVIGMHMSQTRWSNIIEALALALEHDEAG